MPNGSEDFNNISEAEPSLVPINQFKVDALDLLDNATDYQSGINTLIDYFGSNKFDKPEEAREILSTYANDLRHKFKAPSFSIEDVVDIAPIKMSEIDGADSIERINRWEADNIKSIQESSDPDYIAAQIPLTNSIQMLASEARRDEYDGGDGLMAWGKDKFFRFAEGAVSPFAKLIGEPELTAPLHERTSRSRDEGTVGQIASALGYLVPSAVAGAVSGGSAVLPVLGVQAAGEMRGAYEESIKATGNETRAAGAALLTGAAQGVMFVPLGKAISGATQAAIKGIGTRAVEDIASKTLLGTLAKSLQSQKITASNVAISTIEAGAAGAAGHVIGNIASNIGLDQNGDITHGALDSALTNAIIAGAAKGMHAITQNAIIADVQKKFKELDEASSRPKSPEEIKSESESSKTSNPEYTKDEDGFLVRLPPKPKTVDQRIADKEFYEKAVEDYINEPLRDDPPHQVLDETGRSINLPIQPDIEVFDRPEGTLLTDQVFEDSPLVSLVNFAGRVLGANYELRRNIANGALGSQQGDTVRLLRSIGANPNQLKSTLAHEIGHFVDRILNSSFQSEKLRSVAAKLSGVKNLMQDAISSKTLTEDAKAISMDWRKGWDGSKGNAKSPDPAERFRAYRNKPEEIYADVFSALANAPLKVKENYPVLYETFEKSLARNKDLSSFWTELQKMGEDPTALSNFNMQVKNESRSKQGNIEAAQRLNEIQNNSLGARVSRGLNEAFEFVFNRYSAAKQIVNKQVGDIREQAFESFLNLKRKDYLYHWIDRNLDSPTQALLSKIIQADIPVTTWAHYEWAQHLINNKTSAMVKVENDFPLYREAGEALRSYLKQDTKVNQKIVDKVFTEDTFTSPDKLNDALAQLGFIGDTAEALRLEDFRQKYSPADPQRDKKAMRDYNRAVANLNRRKESIPIEALRKHVNELPDTPLKEALQTITKDGAFNARKYLVNADGATIYDAKRDLATIQSQLTPEQFDVLTRTSKDFHEVLARTHDAIKKSEMFSPEVLETIEINKGSYITTNILKYFEGDDSINSSIRKSVGSLSEAGDELASTYLKSAHIYERATVQIARNEAIKLADMGGLVTDIIPQKYNQNLFAERDSLSKGDRNNSYLVGYKNGNPAIYKISGGKSFENMFKNVRSLPGIEWLLTTTDALNKALLTRQFKTVLSGPFVLAQKFYDRKLEAVMANSFEITLGLPIHTSGKLRKMDKATVEEIKHYKKTGELTGKLKEIVDLDGATLDLNTQATEKIPTGTSFSDAIYEAYGAKLPNEKGTLERIGDYTQKALDKIGGKVLKDIAEFDELRTKVNGYRIGKNLGMSNAEAAVFAQERFGIPDPLAGGVAATLINRMFLFGRAHLNGLRVLGANIKDMPKTTATQLAYRVLLPKLPMMAAIMVPALRVAWGDEEAEKYALGVSMIPKYDKIATNPILLGFQDAQGQYHNLRDVKLTDINADWKAWYTRFPQARELTTATKIIWPFIEGLGKGDVGEALSGSLRGAQSEFTGNVQPMIQYAINMLELARGSNPTDFYRMKGILDKDTAIGGSAFDKLEGYGQYVLANQYPMFAPYNPFASKDAKGTLETTIKEVPLIGPMARRFIGVSNYGLMEQAKEGELQRERLDAQILLSSGDMTKKTIDEYRIANAQISSLGKGWQEKLGGEAAHKSKMLTAWHTKIWVPYKNELRAAQEAGDSERYSYLLKELEDSASSLQTALGE